VTCLAFYGTFKNSLLRPFLSVQSFPSVAPFASMIIRCPVFKFFSGSVLVIEFSLCLFVLSSDLVSLIFLQCRNLFGIALHQFPSQRSFPISVLGRQPTQFYVCKIFYYFRGFFSRPFLASCSVHFCLSYSLLRSE